MALSDDLINFDLIETHKENIQQLPGGRSARQLVSILSPLPSVKTGGLPTLDETKNLNDAIRQEYENELLSIADSDDPLDIFDRYVKWTLNAYPSAQATPQSQLLPLLERATKSFLTSSHYRNDPRYLKLWLHYIRLFSDAPRETFAFLARHHIGENLGLFYEEFATWLEGAGRWNQADEVYRMGIEKEARPAERLMRKYNQFQQRFEARPENSNEPSSPALPTVRPALAAKIDPFASAGRAEDPQADRPGSGGAAGKPKSGRAKMAIFSDADNETPPPTASTTRGWDSIGSMKERKKENTVEARPWAGETLKAGKKVGTVPKMDIFRDPNAPRHETKITSNSRNPHNVNPKTGRAEQVFVSMEAVYPSETEEFSFEELRALKRGWMHRDWSTRPLSPMQPSTLNVLSGKHILESYEPVDVENLSHELQQRLDIHDTSTQSMVGMPEPRSSKPKKLKVREIKQETQTVKTRLDSPTGRKIKRKGSAEPTMTFHSKAATNEIYDMFNQSRRPESKDDTQSGDETDYGEDTYSIAGESVNTGLLSGNNSEFGDDTTRSFDADNTVSQTRSVSPWSDFTTSKHVPKANNGKAKHKRSDSEDFIDNIDSDHNQATMNTGSFDTVAIAALANQNFDDLDTKMIAQLAGDGSDDEDDGEDKAIEHISVEQAGHSEITQADIADLRTPIEEPPDEAQLVESHENTRYIPLPPEDFEPTPVRTYRDPAVMAQNKLPFMTPIVERTESSLAPSTMYHNQYDEIKTPSRSRTTDQSPSKLQIDELLLGSPCKNKESPSPLKRHRTEDEDLLEDENLQTLQKKHISDSPVLESGNVPFIVAKDVVTQMPAAAPTPAASPHEDVLKAEAVARKDGQPTLKSSSASKTAPITASQRVRKGPIVPDLQCNPIDPAIQQQILRQIYPAPASYQGYNEHDEDFAQLESLRKYARKVKSTRSSPRKSPHKSSGDRNTTKVVAPLLNFSGSTRVYSVKRELGEGAFAAVYLVESHDSTDDAVSDLDSDRPDKPQPKGTGRNVLEAIKSESPASSLAWEFHVLHLLRSRLGVSDRAMESVIAAHECHLYRDECYLVLDYHSQGTILELVNKVRSDNSRAGKPVEGLEETVAMWLSVEVLRTMESFHRVGILHGDLKIDNCLARFEPNVELLTPYSRHGDDGWSSKGMMLIDFGRGVDVKAFQPDARFVADWKAEETDCAEIREARPWKWEIDLFGAAGIIHSLLFGKYIETVAVTAGANGGGIGPNQKKEWKLKESFKRYWEKEIWSEVFNVLVNGGGRSLEDHMREIARVRHLMEDWLEKEGERGGRDLRAGIRRCERLLGISGNSGNASTSRNTSRGRAGQ